jgi:hypothetical protein
MGKHQESLAKPSQKNAKMKRTTRKKYAHLVWEAILSNGYAGNFL